MTAEKIEFDPLLKAEFEVIDPAELIRRQVHSQRYKSGRISSQAFEQNSGDDGKLSCTRASLVSATDAMNEFLNRGGNSVGGAEVTVAEVRSGEPLTVGDPAVASLRVVDDKQSNPTGLPEGHCYVDYRPIGSSRQTKKAKQLAFYANDRGLKP